MKSFRACLLALLLAACTFSPHFVPPLAPSIAAVPASLVDGSAVWYDKAVKAGIKVYPVDTENSLITVTVRRGGALSRFGHDHVVASRSVVGFVAPDAGRADFSFRLDAMTVDEAVLRTAAGLDTQPSADAIEGTRGNMLGRVLAADVHPVVTLHAQRLAGVSDVVRLDVTLHGMTRTVDVPVLVERGKTSLTSSGALTLKQTDFGITPMSVMGGAMVVQDQMELTFKIVATAPRAGAG